MNAPECSRLTYEGAVCGTTYARRGVALLDRYSSPDSTWEGVAYRPVQTNDTICDHNGRVRLVLVHTAFTGPRLILRRVVEPTPYRPPITTSVWGGQSVPDVYRHIPVRTLYLHNGVLYTPTEFRGLVHGDVYLDTRGYITIYSDGGITSPRIVLTPAAEVAAPKRRKRRKPRPLKQERLV